MDGRPPYVTTRLPGRRLSYLIHNAPGDVHPQELTHAMQSTPSSTCLNLPYSYRLVVKTQVQDQGLSSQSLASSRSHVLQQQQRKQSYFCCTISGLWGHNGVRVSTASGRIWPHTHRETTWIRAQLHDVERVRTLFLEFRCSTWNPSTKELAEIRELPHGRTCTTCGIRRRLQTIKHLSGTSTWPLIGLSSMVPMQLPVKKTCEYTGDRSVVLHLYNQSGQHVCRSVVRTDRHLRNVVRCKVCVHVDGTLAA